MDRELAGPVRATHLLHYSTALDAMHGGRRRYHLGEGGDSKDLARFKESLGACPVDHPELRVERLPFSRVDCGARRMALRALRGVGRG
ncbi:MAG: hypothetical protein P8N02_19980 [Actinomycetota bacterium]|jgi:hypothetical protein|nr:hypothetical protein [Actinomycetota bacterium]